MTGIFVSYSRKDHEFVERIKPVLLRLKLELGLDFFQDIENIRPGEEWEQKIDVALEKCSVILCFLSPEFFASSFIQKKELPLIEHAFLSGHIVLCLPVRPTYTRPQDFLSQVQWLSPPNEPLCNMSEQDLSSFVISIEEGIRETVKEISATPPEIRRQQKVRYNLVVIGKAGVGKTQLINYLLGKELLSTGIGIPITGLGFHRTDLIVSGVPTTIWDSAGLEVGRHEEWLKVLRNELKDRGPTQPVDKWFHTVLYCVQGPGNRIEPYEIQVINSFLKEKYKVIIVITKAFVGQEELEELAKSIRKHVNQSLAIIFVNSRNKEVAGGIVIPANGKGMLTREIQIALIESLTERIPLRCIRFMEEYLDHECNKLVQYVERSIDTESRSVISNYVGSTLRKIANEVTSPRGLFHHIIIRETRQTLTVYKEIAGLVEQAMVLTESESIVRNVQTSASLPSPPKFWSRFEEKMDEFYDWDLEDSWGEIVDTASKVVTSPFALIYSLIATSVEAIQAWLEWKIKVIAYINEYVGDLKSHLKGSETSIRRLFSEEVRKL